MERQAVLYKEPRRARAQIWQIVTISVLSGPLQTASKCPGPDLANFGYFCIKRSFTKSLEGPGPKRKERKGKEIRGVDF